MKRSYTGPPGGTLKKMKRSGRGPSTITLAKRVAKLEKQTEWKSKDFFAVSTDGAQLWNPSGTVTPIFQLATGAGPDERVGRKVTVRSIQLHWGCLNENLFNTDTDPERRLNPVRTMIVFDKQSNSGVPSYNTIVKDNLGLGDQAWSFKNLDNKDRFVILYDSFAASEAGDSKSRDSVRVNYAGGVAPSSDREVIYGKVYRTMDFPVIFGGLSTEPISGSIYVVTCGKEPTTAGYGKFLSRVRYVDE